MDVSSSVLRLATRPTTPHRAVAASGARVFPVILIDSAMVSAYGRAPRSAADALVACVSMLHFPRIPAHARVHPLRPCRSRLRVLFRLESARNRIGRRRDSTCPPRLDPRYSDTLVHPPSPPPQNRRRRRLRLRPANPA